MTFNFHDLVDDQLGTLLNDLPYVLAPGAFSPQVIIPETVMAPVVNTATWTAVTSIGGYTVDNTIPFSWVDISATGTPLNLTDDGEADNINIISDNVLIIAEDIEGEALATLVAPWIGYLVFATYSFDAGDMELLYLIALACLGYSAPMLYVSWEPAASGGSDAISTGGKDSGTGAPAGNPVQQLGDVAHGGVRCRVRRYCTQFGARCPPSSCGCGEPRP